MPPCEDDGQRVERMPTTQPQSPAAHDMYTQAHPFQLHCLAYICGVCGGGDTLSGPAFSVAGHYGRRLHLRWNESRQLTDIANFFNSVTH